MVTVSTPIKLDKLGNQMRIGDFVRLDKYFGSLCSLHEYRRDFRKCSGRIFAVAGFDLTGALWIPLKSGSVLSVMPEQLVTVRRSRKRHIS